MGMPPVPAAPAPAPVIAAAPQMRDLQKELTTMVPAALMKKKKMESDEATMALPKGAAGPVLPSSRSGKPGVNLAPDVGDDGAGPVPELKSSLASVLPKPAGAAATGKPKTKAEEEYERFLKEMEGLV